MTKSGIFGVLPTFLALSCNFWELMKLDGFLLDNDELKGVDNEADDWQVINLQFLSKSGIFGVFCLLFWHLPVIFGNL